MVVLAAACLGGCGEPRLPDEEAAFLREVARAVEPLKARYEELSGFDPASDPVRSNFISHTYRRDPKAGVPLFSSNYFWIKFSLTSEPVEAFDSPPPALTVKMPRYGGKFLKLRVRGPNLPLKQELTRAVYQIATDAGGTDPRFGILVDTR